MKRLLFIFLQINFLYSMSAQAQNDTIQIKKFADIIKKLHNNPYEQWPEGTRFSIHYLDSTESYKGAHHYVQPSLEYLIGVDTLSRRQNIEGKTHKQSFPINNESGLKQSHLRSESTEQGKDTILNIDKVKVLSLMVESSMDWIGVNSGGLTITNQWIWKKFPYILLREEQGEKWWAITSFQKTKKVDEIYYACIEVKSKSELADGYVLNTIYYSPEVPGFIVESIAEHYKKDENEEIELYMIQHEKIANIKL